MESSPGPVVYPDNFFRKKHTATVSFAAGILLFLLPFAEIKCTSIELAGNTGIGIALGTEWKVAMGSNELIKEISSPAKTDETKKALSSGPNIFMLVALAAAVAGLVISFSVQQWRSVVGMCAGILACIMFIAVMIQYKIVLRSVIADKQGGASLDYGMNKLIKVSFTIWYYLSFAAFAAAAFFSYKHYKIDMQDAMDSMVDFEFQRKKT